MDRTLPLFSLVFLCVSCSSPSVAIENGIFSYESESDNRAMVLDYQKKLSWIQDKRKALSPVGNDIGGGPLIDCSDADRLCVDGPFSFSIDRKYNNSLGSMISDNCFLDKFTGESLDVKCKSNDIDILFEYSSSRGIYAISWDEYGQRVIWKCVNKICPLSGAVPRVRTH